MKVARKPPDKGGQEGTRGRWPGGHQMMLARGWQTEVARREMSNQ